MTAPLGAWKNAPLAYVLAEVRTEQIADLADFQQSLAAKLRSEYPIQRKLISAKFVATPNGISRFDGDQEQSWEFASPDNHTGIVLRKHGIVLHATKYEGSTDFLGRLRDALTYFAAVIPNVFVNRLGLRYVDFVIPKKDETPKDYIRKELNPDLGLALAGASPVTISIARYPVTNGHILLRCVMGVGQPELPPDLATFELEKSQLMKVQGLDPSQPTAIIDTDRIREYPTREKLDPGRVYDEFVKMRSEEKLAFRTVITRHALKEWGANEQ